MDAVTHVLAGYVVALGVAGGMGWWRARRTGATANDASAWAAVAGAAALAPDLDVAFIPLTFFGPLYPLQHRGATHSVLGAPIMALGFVALLALAARRWPRFDVFRWRRGFVVPILIGAWSHLILDVVTHQGAPLAWPFSETRTSLELYYWIIWWLAPISLVPLVLRFRGRWDDRRVVQAAVLVLVLMVAMGGLRWNAKPAGDEVFATRDPLEWTVAREMDNGTWRLWLVQGGAVLETRWYAPDVPTDAQEAVEQVQATYAYRGFRFGSTAPHVVQAEPRVGGWNVTIIDTVQRFEADIRPDWLPAGWRDDAGLFEATVVEGSVAVQGRWS